MGMFTFSTKRQREPDAVNVEDNAAREKKVCVDSEVYCLSAIISGFPANNRP